jgi:vacuolar-type H+-ATPase subunit H
VEDTGQAKERVQDAKEQARGKLREQVDQRSTQAGEQISSAADDVRSVAGELRTQGKNTPARYADQAADKAQEIGQRLQNANGDELLRDVEDFARRNPWAVAAGGLVLGLAASRMLKASSGERYRSSMSNGNGATGETRSLPPERTSSLASDPDGSMISTEPRS